MIGRGTIFLTNRNLVYVTVNADSENTKDPVHSRETVDFIIRRIIDERIISCGGPMKAESYNAEKNIYATL